MPSGNKGPAARGQGPAARWARIAVVVLLGLNVVAAGMVLFPPGGSAESLEKQLAALQSQIGQKRELVERTRQHAASVEKGRADGDSFLDEYFLARRTAYAAVVSELGEAARGAKIKEREITFSPEPIEGSDELSMMTITANYEGSYRDLVSFIRQIDQSPRLLIIESLTAAPQAGGNTLAVSMKIDAFVREEGGAPAQAPPAQVPAAGPVAALTPGAGR
jgi:Tfp pilus assembly protein PilO